MKQYQAYINGKFVNSEQHIQIYSPETDQLIGSIPQLTHEQIDQAYAAAQAAFTTWSSFPPNLRAQYLLAFAAALKNHVHELAELLVWEIAKPLKDAETEILRTVDYVVETVHEYLDWIKHPQVYDHENYLQMPKNKVAIYHHKPHGVALTISPFNYPVNLMIAKIAPALIVGNCVVHKSATQGSLVGAYIIELFDQIVVEDKKLPPGVINYVCGQGSKIGDYLIQHPSIDVASFTGSTNIGKKLAQAMVMTPYVLELGGKDAALVLDDADEKRTVQEIVKGSMNYSGQRCTAIKRVLVSDKKAEKLVPMIVDAVSQLSCGLAHENSDITALVDDHAVKLAQELYQDAISKGAKSLLGTFQAHKRLVHPIVLDHVTPEMKVAWIEPFAPILPIIRYDNLDQAIQLINDSEYGLQGSIFTSVNNERLYELANQINTGTVNINKASSRGPDILPFIGVKASGFGVQGIRPALEFFTRLQGLVINE